MNPFFSVQSIVTFIFGAVSGIAGLYLTAYIHWEYIYKPKSNIRLDMTDLSANDPDLRARLSQIPEWYSTRDDRGSFTLRHRETLSCAQMRVRTYYYYACIEGALLNPNGGCELQKPEGYIIEPDDLPHAKDLLKRAQEEQSLECPKQ